MMFAADAHACHALPQLMLPERVAMLLCAARYDDAAIYYAIPRCATRAALSKVYERRRLRA